MNALKTGWGVFRYEFLMQIRRPALWLAFLGFAVLTSRSIFNMANNPYFASMHLSNWQLAATITLVTNWLAPLGVGILLADRLARDRRTRVEELFNTLPGTLRMRLFGKYLGTTLASLVPAFLLFLFILGIVISQTQNFMLLPMGLLCYVAIVLPGMLFIAAFALAGPSVIWVPLYQFLFFGYWFWGNVFSPIYGLPTLSGTILTPIGGFIGAGLFGAKAFGWTTQATMVDGIASIALLVGIAVVVLFALNWFLKWEQTRQ